MKSIGLAFVLGILGLGVGYGIFGQINGNYIRIEEIFSQKSGVVENVVSFAIGLDDIRTRILGCGAIGAVLGLFLPAVGGGKK